MSKINLTVFTSAFVALIQISFASDLDPSFRSALNGRAGALVVQEDGRAIVAGSFTNGVSVISVARLLVDGSLDESFNPIAEVPPETLQNPVSRLAVQGDGKILIAGAFTRVNGIARTNIARLNSDGSLDQSFNPVIYEESAIRQISEIVVQSDGGILLGGIFDAVDEQPRNSLVRLKADGAVDTNFVPFSNITNESVWVFGLALQKDAKILVYGRFVTTRDDYRHYLLRLNPDGTHDTTFAANTSNEVEALAVQLDQKIVIGGDFIRVDGVTRLGLARLESNGSLDLSFAPVGDYESILAILPLSDGTILLGGDFEEEDQIGGVPSNPTPGFRFPTTGLIRLDTSGALERSLKLDWPKTVWDLDLQKNGKVLLVGQLETANGPVDGAVARLEAMQKDLSICCVAVEDRSFRFNIISLRGGSGLIEFSTDLLQWETLQEIQLEAGLPAQISDTNYPTSSQRFYRASTQL